MRVVLDVNVWVSGLLWRGVPGRIFDLAAANKITIYTSEPIIADVEEILARKKFQSKINALNTTVKELLSTVKQLSYSCIITSVEAYQLRDPDDTVILATALSANAEAIVTGDLDLLVLIEFNKIPILILEKITHQNLDLDEFLQGLEDLKPDSNQPTLEEISEIVKDVRQELWSNR